MPDHSTPPERPDGSARSGPGDPYSRVDYRRVVAWERRVAREGPALRRWLEAAPDRSVLDLGCGTGEHVAFFADEGARAVGLDRSETMIAAAREHEAAGRGRFVLGDTADAAALLADEPPFGLAICLGNVLPHLRDDDALARFLSGARAALCPGGLLVVQLLNYRRIRERGERHLPLNIREGDDGREVVFLRLMRDLGDGRMLFLPTTLEVDPDADEPVVVKSSRRIELRAWDHDELAGHFAAAGFSCELCGDIEGGPFEPSDSRDLVLAARRE